MTETVTIDDLVFAVRRSAKRKTVGITIDRTGSLLMHVPIGCPKAAMKAVGRQKRLWVYSRLAERELLFHPRRTREFVTGEGFFYLGRSYRLLLVKPPRSVKDAPPLRLHEGRFKLLRSEINQADKHFRDWYVVHGQAWIKRRVELLAPRIGVEPHSVVVRDLGYRWGSCGRRGVLYFHWRTACLPPSLIEYLAVHELLHLIQPHHNRDFTRRIERVIPDYLARKRALAENGGRYV